MGRVEVLYALTCWMRFTIVMFGDGVVFYLHTVDMKESYFAFKGTVQKCIAQGMHVSRT